MNGKLSSVGGASGFERVLEPEGRATGLKVRLPRRGSLRCEE